MRKNRVRRNPRLPWLLASLVMVPVLVLVPASLPLCAMEMDLCPEAEPVVPVASMHCPIDADGAGEMPCCVEDAAPQGPAPAAPGKADADLRVQLKAPAPVPMVVQGFLPARLTAGLELSPAVAPAPSAVPLYTLLSSLLS